MITEPLKLFSYGKVLLTGEYAVLKGAKALSLPVKYGQTMIVKPQKNDLLEWKSYLKNNQLLLDLKMTKDLEEVISVQPENAGSEIIEILRILKRMQPNLFKRGYKIDTKFEFDLSYGLGSSSTLIANLSKWAQVNPFELLDATFNGSGYDVVTSLSGKPVLFQRTGLGRQWKFVKYYPRFHKHLFFIHLNKKQPTHPVVQRFKKVEIPKEYLDKISSLTEQILEARKLEEFQNLITEHEEVTGKIIRQKPVKQRLFADYDGAVKSLGAWGGDMILAAGDPQTTPEYFKSKGYEVIFPFAKLIHKEKL
ncbi:MAG: 30S ribosomal protein S6 [Chlorobi bacterium]|nr:30S ribosomal protein S6 [Chlorobiota bacterium]